jgi:protoporphyrinogen oxidase
VILIKRKKRKENNKKKQKFKVPSGGNGSLINGLEEEEKNSR